MQEQFFEANESTDKDARAEAAETSGQVEAQAVWRTILEDIQEHLGLQRFSIWFRRTCLREVTDSQIRVGVPNLIIKQYMEQRYRESVADSACRVIGRPVEVSFEVDPELFRRLRSEIAREAARASRREAECPALKVAPPSEESAPAPRMPGDYLAGDFNRMVEAALGEMLNGTSTRFHFLGVHGGHGTGKTTYLRRVRDAFAEHRPRLNIQMTTAETWTNEFFYSLQNGQMSKFRRRYRECDLLLIDDIHFFQGKKTPQEELLYTLKALQAGRKSAVLTSTVSFLELSTFLPALHSFLYSWLSLGLGTLSSGDRTRLFAELAQRRGVRYAEEVADLIAGSRINTIRELEKAVTALSAHGAFMKVERIDMPVAMEALRGVLPGARAPLTLEAVESVVLKRFRITAEALRGPSRCKAVTWPRQVAMYLAHREIGLTLENIGRFFGGRNHSTVKHAIGKVEEAVAATPAAARLIEELTRALEGV